MLEKTDIVYVVDDDAAVRDAIAKLVNSVGMKSICFTSAEAFLATYTTNIPGCLVLDVRMSGVDGLELQKELKAKNLFIPVIIITGHGDIPMAVEALNEGAINFIEKPFRNQTLLDAIRKALRKDKLTRESDEKNKHLIDSYGLLTDREKEVSKYIEQGLQSKQIAQQLHISPRTIESHRANILRKMNSLNTFELMKKLIEINLVQKIH